MQIAQIHARLQTTELSETPALTISAHSTGWTGRQEHKLDGSELACSLSRMRTGYNFFQQPANAEASNVG